MNTTTPLPRVGLKRKFIPPRKLVTAPTPVEDYEVRKWPRLLVPAALEEPLSVELDDDVTETTELDVSSDSMEVSLMFDSDDEVGWGPFNIDPLVEKTKKPLPFLKKERKIVVSDDLENNFCFQFFEYEEESLCIQKLKDDRFHLRLCEAEIMKLPFILKVASNEDSPNDSLMNIATRLYVQAKRDLKLPVSVTLGFKESQLVRFLAESASSLASSRSMNTRVKRGNEFFIKMNLVGTKTVGKDKRSVYPQISVQCVVGCNWKVEVHHLAWRWMNMGAKIPPGLEVSHLDSDSTVLNLTVETHEENESRKRCHRLARQGDKREEPLICPHIRCPCTWEGKR
ncbi:uncharacterized protein MONOS_9965 [Monocercomonoides exilis]|uniref:uncharacterized protein n=1 Tax=Monocercomonoides exilis TaxID=2049356 RepID=UPI003559522F|nr:hypothetical protein MONOS_9965 [Monocercomonoides exilis]|eukprot:MONOS_9965.1-p1 / transcript=MONOS_9965.1 / gene=MONOS_9965 / organism=Monocercomonoides_exilis_PA203 / gene_product=unspecified product / transcript_product=unspecified product / location=Mono_scaffold00432:10931-12480(-) / protein_length=341 / sequence_SO=supercontig / SO=protein_coding / is_pseudo=false